MSARTTNPSRPFTKMPLGTVILYGAAAGVLGVAGMTLSEKTEQSITNRPNSYVPGKTLARLLNVGWGTDSQIWGLNMAMHYGQGAVAGVIRGLMASWGVHGPFGDLMFVGVRLLIDQTLENWTGVGALPWTWPVSEQIIDILHKAVYAFGTGFWADRWIR